MPLRRPGQVCIDLRRDFLLQRRRQQRTQSTCYSQQRPDATWLRQDLRQCNAHGAVFKRTFNLGLQGCPANVQQIMIFHPRGASRLTVAAAQAAIQVMLGQLRCRLAFQEHLDQINTAPWPVQLVALVQIGRTGGITKPAMHTGAQNGLGLLGLRQLLSPFSQLCLHVDSAALNKRPGLKMATGSSCCLRRWCHKSKESGNSSCPAPSPDQQRACPFKARAC